MQLRTYIQFLEEQEDRLEIKIGILNLFCKKKFEFEYLHVLQSVK